MARLLSLTLNGRARTDAVPDNVLLLDYLREVVGLTGTKTGCDGGECGACTVLIDDSARLSCLTLAATVANRRVDTIESLAIDGRLSAVQRGFHEKLGAQWAIARRASSWRRPDCCGAIRVRPMTKFARRSAATSADAPDTSKSSKQ
jgi:aerobic-type carbon monoxide dehydrogenase small subunit (CoxS/CutS family)